MICLSKSTPGGAPEAWFWRPVISCTFSTCVWRLPCQVVAGEHCCVAVWYGRYDWPAHSLQPFCQHASEKESCRLALMRWWWWCITDRSCRAEIPDICRNGWIPLCHWNNRTGIAAGSATATGKTRGHPEFVYKKSSLRVHFVVRDFCGTGVSNNCFVIADRCSQQIWQPWRRCSTEQKHISYLVKAAGTARSLDYYWR